MQSDYKHRIGSMIQEVRNNRGLTQKQLASALGTSQSAINRIENGGQNISLEMIARIGDVLSSEIVSLNRAGSVNFRIHGGRQLSGSIEVKTSKNAAVALLCASLLNHGTTTLRRMPRIEEVSRLIEFMVSIGVKIRWLDHHNDLEITPPAKLSLAKMDAAAGRRTRSVIMFMGPLMHAFSSFKLPYAGGCKLGERTIEPHLYALEGFGLTVKTEHNYYQCTSKPRSPGKVVMYESGNTPTENAIMAAALTKGKTVIRRAASNYMVVDLCLFLQKLGVKISGIGTHSLTIYGQQQIRKNVEYWPCEDPIEAMTLLSIAATTNSPITIKRVPIDFIDLELLKLEKMGFLYEASKTYKAHNGVNLLVDITCKTTEKLIASKDKLEAHDDPGMNMDSLPYFVPVAARAHGKTLIHDWAYENRAIYYTELNSLGANVQLVDIHRVYVIGPTRWQATEVICPPALRPAVLILIGMLAAPGISTLRNVYSINRGYEDLAERLNQLGAKIEPFREI